MLGYFFYCALLLEAVFSVGQWDTQKRKQNKSSYIYVKYILGNQRVNLYQDGTKRLNLSD